MFFPTTKQAHLRIWWKYFWNLFVDTLEDGRRGCLVVLSIFLLQKKSVASYLADGFKYLFVLILIPGVS